MRTEAEIIRSWGGDFANPLVSICCITYNHEKFIEDALQGFLIQKTSFPFEILIHDDASTDNTANIIRNYEKKYPNILKPIYQKENQFSKGINPIYSYIFQGAKGKYLALCEGDDYWISSNKIQRQFEVMETNKDVGMVHTDVLYIDEKSQPTMSPEGHDLFRYRNRKGYLFWDLLLNGNSILTVSTMIKRELAMQYPGWFYYDYWLFLYVSKLSLVGYISEKMAAYRRHEGGIMISDPSYVDERVRWVKLDMLYRYLVSKEDKWEKTNEYGNYFIYTKILMKLLLYFTLKKHSLPKMLIAIIIKRPYLIFGMIYCMPTLVNNEIFSFNERRGYNFYQ